MKMMQNNKLKMAQATLAVIQREENAALWTGIGGIEEAVESFTSTVADILIWSQRQSARTGFTAQKNEARKTMLDTAFTVCSGIKALASATNDKGLSAKVDFSRTDLAQGREVAIVNRCQSILAIGTENAEALAAKYNVTSNDLKALKNAITAFTELQPMPRQGRAAKASATSNLTVLFETLDVTLNEQLDPLLEKFRFSNPAFFQEYRTARSIVDSAASHEGEQVTTVAAELPKAA